jgi:peptide/nickel transport system substrate-binding protein
VNHWRYVLRKLSEREINLILIWIGTATVALLFLGGYDYIFLRVPAPAEGGIYTEGIVGEPRYINPAIAAANEVDRDITTLIFSGLVKHNESGEIVPDLAESYEIKDGGKTYEFTLRENLQWPDKTPITSDDVIFTINLVKDAKYQSPLRNTWQGVKAEKIDDKKLVLKLSVEYEPFLENATLGIMPKHIWEQVLPQNFLLTQLNSKPIGFGPYQLTKITKSAAGKIKSMEFSPNDKYYEKANISTVLLRFYETQEDLINAFKRREVDGLSLNSPLEKDEIKSRSVSFYDIKLPRYFGVFFNQGKSKVLSELDVRKALEMATDKNRIVEEILKNEASVQNGPFTYGLLEIKDPEILYPFDMEKAGQALDKTGWKVGTSGIREKKLKGEKTATPLEFTLTTTDWPELTQIASMLKNDWAKIGVKVNLDIVPVSAVQTQSIRPRQYEALLFGEVLTLNPDPFSFWHSTQRKDPGLNLAIYSNKKVDGLLETARQESDPEVKSAKYEEFQKIIISEIPAIFLYSPNYIYALPPKIKGMDTQAINTPSQRFENINKWYTTTKRVSK